MDIQSIRHNTLYLMPVNVISLSLCVELQSNGCVVGGIFDNNVKTHGKQFRGVNISSPHASKDLPPNAVAIVCSFRSEAAIARQLTDMGVRSISCQTLISSADADSLAASFAEIDAKELNDIAPQYRDLRNVAKLRIKQALLPAAVYEKKNPLIVSSMNLMITERCSLRCRNCSSLMPYFAHPRDYSFESVTDGLACLLERVDHVRDVWVLGGEPLLHERLADIVEFTCRQRKVATIAIVTNATVLPGDALCERLALQGNLLILISDYGDYSKGKSELLERLERHGIPYVFMSGMVWYEHALLLDAYSRSPEEVQESYRMCARNCTSVAERRFSKCQVALSLELLNAIPPEFEALEKSTVDLSACNGPDGAGGKEEIAAHMRSDRAMGACYVCSGMSRDGAVRIPPAVQATGALAYRRF